MRIFLWSCLAVITTGLLFMAVVPGGTVVYETDFNDKNRFIGKLTPAERVIDAEDGLEMTGEPAYFSLATPRGFDRAKLTLTFKDLSSSPIIEAGVLTDKKVWNYDLEPISNKLIDGLASEWPSIEADGKILLQKEKQYENLDSFFARPPDYDEISVYNYDLKSGFKAGQGLAGQAAIEVPLRGPFQAMTYLQDGYLELKFIFKDINKNRDTDPIDINIYRGEDIIRSLRLEDDGVTGDAGDILPSRPFRISLENIAAGLYKIEIKCNSDIITERIDSLGGPVSFINKVWIADSGRHGISLYTDSRVVTAETINPARLQKISVDGKELKLNETYKQFGMRTDNKPSRVTLERDDVIVSGDGMISFDRQSLFNPMIRKLNENSDVSEDGTRFILAEYSTPVKKGEWQTAEAIFDLTKAYRENGRYSFLISAPRLGTPSNPGKIIINGVRVELEGKNIIDFIRSRWNKITGKKS